MARALVLAAVLGLVAGCGGSSSARVKGRLVSNGQPLSFAGNQSAVTFTPVGADGKPDAAKSYSAMVADDGAFELIASGGELPPGTYAVSLKVLGKSAKNFKAVADGTSPIRRELKPGPNDLTIDVANPTG